MKSFLTLIFGFIATSCLFAQVKYQAAVRDVSGNLIVNQIVNFEIELTQNNVVIYQEIHNNVNTGVLGLVNLEIGEGTSPSVNFNDIDWSLENYELKVSLNGEFLGSTKILPVPIAEYAKRSGSSEWSKNENNDLFYTNGRVGIGTSSPFSPLDVRDGFIRIESATHEKLRFLSSTSTHNNDIRSYDEIGGQMWRMSFGQRSQNNRFILRSSDDNGVFWITQGGTTNLRCLYIQGGCSSKVRFYADNATQNNDLHSFDENNNQMWRLSLGQRSQNNRFILRGSDDSGVLWVTQSGQTNVKCLKINGGCDLKEDFNSIEVLEPGEIVILDEFNPGQLLRTSKPYDKRVAGIISGANGINPGLTLSQEDLPQGEFPLAMVGQVYVKATGKVRVGDMLTTSGKSGYAMAAKIKSKAHGAVVGKAMSSLEGGEGFVLVLVNLQ